MGYNMLVNTNRRYSKLGVYISLIVLFLLDAWNLSHLYRGMSEDKRKRRECTETVAVEVSNVESIRKTRYGRRRRSYRSRRTYYVYRAWGTYTVDGREYEFHLPQTRSAGEYYEGKQYTLKYNRENAADYYIVGNNTRTDKFVFTLIRLAVYAIIFVFFWGMGKSSSKVRKKEEGSFRRVSSGSSAASDDTWDPFNGIR